MTDTDMIMNPQYFSSYPAGVRIRIQMNPEIRIQIPDQFWLRLDALAEVRDLWVQSSSVVLNCKEYSNDADTEFTELLRLESQIAE